METIRRIHLDEFERYKKIRIESLKDAPYAFSTKLKEAIKRTDKEWIEQANGFAVGNKKCAFFALENRKTIGFCALYKDQNNVNEAELVQFWINPDYRGKNISKDLVLFVFGWAKENDIYQIKAIVKYYNERAITFFEKCGFVRLDKKENDNVALIYTNK